MRITRAILVLFVLAIAACGGDSKKNPDAKPPTPDANTTPDASPPDAMTANALGTLCDNNNQTMPCPAGNQCVVVTGVGSQTQGYCSPVCNGMDTICSTGYTGPAGGMERCALGAQGQPPDACVIICTAPAQCPTGTACTAVTGQTVKICVAP
jgi:hypothetical protein